MNIHASDTKSIDAIDKRILRIIQQDAGRSLSEIATQVGLSQTPCWKRLRRLAASGVIKRRVVLLDQKKLGLGTTVFVSLQIGDHSSKEVERFAKDVAAMEEVMDFYRLAGDVDYVLRVVVADAAAFDAFYKRLIGLTSLKTVTSRFALENIKSETALPIKD
ncbi:MAG TPA: Lrp/AsnC family transcriptional regulator [Methylocella sp.]|nr:Lrp/AsnC family transcriptional regulator [Methylocella sp.]